MRYLPWFIINFLIFTFSLNAHAYDSTSKARLIDLIIKNQFPESYVHKVIEINIPFFQEKLAPPYRDCLKQEMTLKNYVDLNNNIINRYVNSLPEREINDYVQILSPFTGNNSFKYIFTEVQRGTDLTSDNFSILNTPNAQKLFLNPEYKSLRKMLVIADKDQINTMKIKLFVLATIAAKECNTELPLPK